MPDPTTLALIGVILFFATFARTALGFGDALIAMPLLALVVSMKLAAPLVALVSALNALLILIRDWRSLDLKEARSLILVALACIPLGAWLLDGGDERILKVVLGVVVLGFAIWSLRNPQMPEMKSTWWDLPFGLAAGVLGGAYNTAGPPLVIYAALKKWPRDVFRVILQTYFLPAGLLIVALHAWNGRVTSDVLTTYGIMLPVVGIGVFSGRRFADRIPESSFRTTINVVLLGLGTLLIVGSIFSDKPDSASQAANAANSVSLEVTPTIMQQI